MSKQTLVIATRESPLALQQAELVKHSLLTLYPQLKIEFLGITTKADKLLDVNLNKIGGKGLFVKELETALLEGRADLAVHSMKDVPMDLPDGLILPVIMEREDPRDVFVSHQSASLLDLPPLSKVGTSSLRRQLQLQGLRPDLELINLRGNIHTRLRKLEEGQYDAIILAAAGLKRMALDHAIRETFSIDKMIPSAGQGALGLECLASNLEVLKLIAPLNHKHTQQCVMAERAFTKKLGGGCTAPVAAFAELDNDQINLRGLVAAKNTSKNLILSVTGSALRAEQLGTELAEQLIAQGALEILHEFTL